MKPETSVLLDDFVASHWRFQKHLEPGNYRFPALEFQERHGLQGVGVNWNMPDERGPVELHADFFKYVLKKQIAADLVQSAEAIPELTPVATLGNFVQAQLNLEALQANEARLRKSSAPQEAMDEAVGKQFMANKRVSDAEVLKDVAALEGASIAAMRGVADAVDVQYRHVLQQTFGKLVAANPELGQLDVQSIKQMEDVVEGVLSGFNLADINHYAINGADFSSARTDRANAAKLDRIEAATGEKMQWVPAPSTLLRIQSQLGRGQEQGAQR